MLARRGHQQEFALSAEPTPTVRPPETTGLRLLIRAMMVVLGTFAAIMAATWAVSGDVDLGGSALVDASALVATGIGGLLLSRGRPNVAVTVVTVGTLGVAILLAAIPPATPALAALPLVSGSIALQYVSGRTLRRLLWLSWLTSVLVAVIVELVPVGGTLPDWYYPFMRVLSFAAVTGITVILLQQFGGRLRASLAESEAARAALAESEARHRRVVEELEEVVFRTDVEGRWTLLNPAWTRITGRPVEDSLGQPAAASLSPAGGGSFEDRIETLLTGQLDVLDVSMQLLTATGDRCWVEIRARRALGDDGMAIGLSGTLTDISEQRRLERQLTDLAFRDPLTGLPNRALFRDRVGHALAKRRRSRRVLAILFLDLDGFKAINESMGHAIGDRLLIEDARRLQACLRPGDTVARLGGDEFGLLLEGARDEAEAIEVARRLVQAAREPFAIDDRAIVVSASVGIAIVDRATASVDEALQNAGTAMYRAKGQPDGGYAVFEPSMHRTAMSRLEDMAQLRTALERDEFFLEYQPVVDLATGRMKGVEALVRWRHPERGTVPPGSFIPLAEESGLIVPLGAWIIWEACRQAGEWQRRWPGRLSMSINLSAVQIAHPDLLEHVARGLDASGIEPGLVVLEITETAVMTDPDRALKRLAELKSLGVRLAIDDFGTGYSSLNYVSRFPVDILKLDRSFITGMQLGTASAAMVETFIRLGRLLNLETIAEGVETLAEAEALWALRCQSVQGFYFARPVDAATIEAFLAEDRRWTIGGTGQPEDRGVSLSA
jgi:diguanylate cyclase (GGDEF)-like protein/PAS domain S-box-containing protein